MHIHEKYTVYIVTVRRTVYIQQLFARIVSRKFRNSCEYISLSYTMCTTFYTDQLDKILDNEKTKLKNVLKKPDQLKNLPLQSV